jgi:hypothetical protein
MSREALTTRMKVSGTGCLSSALAPSDSKPTYSVRTSGVNAVWGFSNIVSGSYLSAGPQT